jgi:uncharacterized protein YbjT (DUF2867 family)
MRIALIGATGLVGSHLLPLIRNHDLLVLTRRPTGTGVAEQVAPAVEWPRLLGGNSIDAAVSTLGTTWKKAGSWAEFERVDRMAVVEFARAVRDCGASQLVCVSSVGADPYSNNGYLALKGRTEADLAGMGFDRLDLLRPGLLRGERGSDRRFLERFGIAVSPVTNLFLRGRRDKFAAIDAAEVACSIAALLDHQEPGVFVHHNREIWQLARGATES